MRILVTGSKGIVGTALVNELKKKGHWVFGIDLMHSLGEVGYVQEMSHEVNTYERCDIREIRQLERVISKGFDLVYNCAAEFGRWNGEDYYEKVWETNCIGLKHLLTLQVPYRFKLVHFSSAEVYGDYPNIIFEDTMKEAHMEDVRQMNDYAISKWANELQIMNWQELHPESEIVRVRLFDIQGPGEVYHAYRSVCAKFVYHALHGLPITVFKGHIRCGVYINDTIKALANIPDNFKNKEVYNLGGDVPYTIEELTNLIWDYTGADRNLITWVDEHEKATTKIKVADSSKAKKDLMFDPWTPLPEVVKRTVDWMKEYYAKPLG
jgi:dTDP-glucose 4,6-dehydratase